MRVTSVGYSLHRDGDYIRVNREPLWTYLIEAAVDRLCVLTGHRWCNSCPMRWSMTLSDRHTQTFKVPASRELIHDYERWAERWMGWQSLREDDDDAGNDNENHD